MSQLYKHNKKNENCKIAPEIPHGTTHKYIKVINISLPACANPPCKKGLLLKSMPLWNALVPSLAGPEMLSENDAELPAEAKLPFRKTFFWISIGPPVDPELLLLILISCLPVTHLPRNDWFL